MPGPLFIIGTGPMIGSEVPRLLATKSAFSRIALFARSADTLKASTAFINNAAPSATVHSYIADVTDHTSFEAALEKAIKEVGSPEVVLYNAARIKYGGFGEYKEEDIVVDFKIPALGTYTAAKVLIPHLQALAKEQPDSHPCFFVTSSPIIYQAFAPVFSLSMAKAAQANLVKYLAQENKDVIHVGLVMIAGVVSPEEPINNPKHIAGYVLQLWEQKKGNWALEINVE